MWQSCLGQFPSPSWMETGELTISIIRPGEGVGLATTSSYQYDPWGQRIAATVSTGTAVTRYYPSKYYNVSSDELLTKHIFANGELVATVSGSGENAVVNYVHTDHLGGTNVVTDSDGNVAELADYYPYGSDRLDELTSGTAEQRKFIGQEYDQATQLSYLNARYYNGANGKFLSQDPLFLAIGNNAQIKNLTGAGLQQILADPQSLNGYAYAKNNPIRYLDANGQWFWEFMTFRQSWSGFQGELGEAADQLSQDSSIWNIAFNHPKASGLALGVGSGALAYGAAAGLTYLSAEYLGGLGTGCLAFCDRASQWAEQLSQYSQIYGPSNAQQMMDARKAFDEAGIQVSDHGLFRTIQKSDAQSVINAYTNGTKYYDTVEKNFNLVLGDLRVPIDNVTGEVITVIKDSGEFNLSRFVQIK